MEYFGLNDLRHASNFAAKHFNDACNSYEKHSAGATASLRELNALVVIAKTDDKALEQYNRNQEQLTAKLTGTSLRLDFLGIRHSSVG